MAEALAIQIKKKLSNQKAMQAIVQTLGDLQTDNAAEVFVKAGIPVPGGVKVGQMMAVTQAQINRALKGDTFAATWLRDTGFGKPKDTVVVDEGNGTAVPMNLILALQAERQKTLPNGTVTKIDKPEDTATITVDENGNITAVQGDETKENE